MIVKPYTGAMESWARSVVDALSGRLTLRDNVAAMSVAVEWNSDRAPFSIEWSRQARPRSLRVLSASRLDAPSEFYSGPTVVWTYAGGQVLIQSITGLASSVEWSVDLLLEED